jgi:single-stranded-DNA-specific exonuclease
LSNKNWVFQNADENEIAYLSQTLMVSPLIAHLLINRNIREPGIAFEFLNLTSNFANPYLLKDMDIAVDRIWEAIEKEEKIAVYGDYDADGITATAVLYSFLKSLGADIVYYLPEREGEGYGLNSTALELLKADGVHLIITVDTGITAIHEAEYAKSLDMELIITDHHQPLEMLPSAVAVIDAHRRDCSYPFKGLTGVGIAFKLVCALAGPEKCDALLNHYADIIALGTVADIAPLISENRIFVAEGIKQLSKKGNIGLEALIEKSGLLGRPINSTTIAFVLAPRINAAGRVGKPQDALELLLAERGLEASLLAKKICDDNAERQNYEAKILEKVIEIIEAEEIHKNSNILVVAGENWHNGVIGIVCAKLVERYSRPVILISLDEDSSRGSARSLKGFNLFEALDACSQLLEKFGGHEQAAGISIKRANIDEFRLAINQYAKKNAPDLTQSIEIDCILAIDKVNLKTANEIKKLEPYGCGNPAPIFAFCNMELLFVTPIGKGMHLKLELTDGNEKVSVLYFKKQLQDFPFFCGDRIDVAFSLETNIWMNTEQVSIIVKDIKSTYKDIEQQNKKTYFDLITANINEIGNYKCFLPSKEDFGTVYLYLKRDGAAFYDIYALIQRIKANSQLIDYCKIRLVLDIFKELGLIELKYFDDCLKVNILNKNEKVNLNNSNIVQRLCINV